MNASKLSVVSPVYHGENMLEELVARISKAVAPLTSDYEIILVNDGSPDASWEGIEALCARDTKVKGINLATDTVSWTIGNSNVASIRVKNNVCIVKAVGTGNTTLTATINGSLELKCIVRCHQRVSEE